MTDIPTRDDVVAAHGAIGRYIRKTPVLRTPAQDFGLLGHDITFKLEFLQHTGTFKARGAITNLTRRHRRDRDRPIVAASGGNHGAAVAYAAMIEGRKAHIFVPAIASPAKVARIESYGADVIVGGENYEAALAASADWAASNDGYPIHAYDAFDTLAGQGTVALEFAEQSPDVDTVLVAVGGGGLIGGMAAYYASDVKLVGVEPELAPTLTRAMDAGEPVNVSVGGIAADSLGASRIGSLPFQLAQKYVSQTVLVGDYDIAEAQRALWEVLRVAVEPGGAAAFAALLSGRYVAEPNERVGILLCGANTGALPSGKAAN